MFEIFRKRPSFEESMKVSESLGIAYNKLMRDIEGSETLGQLSVCRSMLVNWNKVVEVYKIFNATTSCVVDQTENIINKREEFIRTRR